MSAHWQAVPTTHRRSYESTVRRPLKQAIGTAVSFAVESADECPKRTAQRAALDLANGAAIGTPQRPAHRYTYSISLCSAQLCTVNTAQ